MARQVSADAVVDAALALADEVGWRRATAHGIGARLGGGPELVLARFRDLDGVADAWFGRALTAAVSAQVGATMPFPDRLAAVLNAWHAALAPHRRTSRAMLRAKLYPTHPHHWVPLVFSLSRLVQWLLDAAQCPSRGRRRQAEEIAVSLLVLETLRRADDAGIADLVARRLRALERRLDRLWPRVSAAGRTGPGLATRAARSRPAAGRSTPAAARSRPAAGRSSRPADRS
jgi:AcrR family transcriptional regulator